MLPRVFLNTLASLLSRVLFEGVVYFLFGSDLPNGSCKFVCYRLKYRSLHLGRNHNATQQLPVNLRITSARNTLKKEDRIWPMEILESRRYPKYSSVFLFECPFLTLPKSGGIGQTGGLCCVADVFKAMENYILIKR